MAAASAWRSVHPASAAPCARAARTTGSWSPRLIAIENGVREMTASQPTPASKVVVVGAPFDANSSFLRGPALAPARIRAALRSGAMNLCVEDGRDLDD